MFEHQVLLGTCLHGIKYLHVLSSKGTLIADKKSLIKELDSEKEIEFIKKEFLTYAKKNIILEAPSELGSLYHSLYTRLTESLEAKERYFILDFRHLILLIFFKAA